MVKLLDLSSSRFLNNSLIMLCGLIFCQLSLSNVNPAQASYEQGVNSTEDLKKPAVMQDLAYANILFEYYRGKPLKALNQILVAQKKGLLPHHQHSAALLSGVIYLDLGMLFHAQKIFTDLLSAEELKTELLSRLEFYLGKIHYRQGDYIQAEVRLHKVVDSLIQPFKDESLIMLGNVALSFEQKEKARNWLLRVSKDSKLSAFSRYNLGVSWLREGDLDSARPFLIQHDYNQDDSVFSDLSSSDTQVIKSLQDKSKIALGYYYLANKQYEKARQSLLQVRLDSLQTNKALLGMGWSYLGTEDYKKALSHWLELASKDVRDIAVQEVLLAIPYAYQKLGSQQQALNAYLEASNSYQQQIKLINKLLFQVEQSELLEKAVAKRLFSQENNLNSHNMLEDGIEDSHLFGDEFDYYLYQLISEHQFNEGFRSYQKLGLLAGILTYWQAQLPVFAEILKANKMRFDSKIPLVDSYLAEGAFEQYNQALSALESDIEQLKNNHQLHLLANQDELVIYNRISSLMDKLAQIPETMIRPQQRLQANRAQGVLQWQLESFKVAKIWSIKKEAMQIRDILNEMATRKSSLATARDKAKIRFAGFQQKVAQGTEQLNGLRDKIAEQIQLQIGVLKRQIIQMLNKRKSALDYLMLQSDLAIARMHGQAVIIPEFD